MFEKDRSRHDVPTIPRFTILRYMSEKERSRQVPTILITFGFDIKNRPGRGSITEASDLKDHFLPSFFIQVSVKQPP